MVSVSIKIKPVLKFGGALYLNGLLHWDSFPVKIFAFFPDSQTSHLVVFTEGRLAGLCQGPVRSQLHKPSI